MVTWRLLTINHIIEFQSNNHVQTPIHYKVYQHVQIAPDVVGIGKELEKVDKDKSFVYWRIQ